MCIVFVLCVGVSERVFIKLLLRNVSRKVCVCDEQEGFQKAMAMVGAEFLDRLDYYKHVWLPARAVVETAVQMRTQVPINQSTTVCLLVLKHHVTHDRAPERHCTCRRQGQEHSFADSNKQKRGVGERE